MTTTTTHIVDWEVILAEISSGFECKRRRREEDRKGAGMRRQPSKGAHTPISYPVVHCTLPVTPLLLPIPLSPSPPFLCTQSNSSALHGDTIDQE
ncbi:hypothetical protein Mapa_014340 [Marchantia paleacea]|nr:hypothetical protein Mapa_014340 [Marchantia paleacea]